jgi:vacuolar-type H+-ATPase subunit H
MVVEALKVIREVEEEGKKRLEAAQESAVRISKAADEEIKGLTDKAREEEKHVAAEIAARYAIEGEREAETIKKTAEAEAGKLKVTAGSNLTSAVNLVLEKILGLR